MAQLKFSMISEPDMFSFPEFVSGIFQTIGLQDSIYDPYPVMTVQVTDDSAIFSEQYFYTQSLDVKIKLSDYYNKTSNFDHNYYINNQSFIVNNSQYMVGMADLSLHSSYKKQDVFKSKSYKGNISDIVRSIILKFQNVIGPPVSYISTTSNYDTWYQSNSRDFSFIELLAVYALNIENSNSPFYTFFNLKGEFYFQTVVDLFAQSPVDTYYYGLNVDNTGTSFLTNQLERNIISDVEFQPLSSNLMLDEYNIKFYKLKNDGTYFSKEYDLKTKISENKLFNNKLTIRKQETEKVRSIYSFGLIDNDNQENHYKGWLNEQFINSISFPYRLTVSMKFDTRLCSGKVIELKFKSPIQNKNNESFEYSGNWLILKSRHIFDEKGIGYTTLLLGKSSVNVFKNHKMYNDFI
jgi:hypothetical protein